MDGQRSSQDANEFATVLRAAITASGMSLAQIVENLAERDTKVTQAALSYWQSGRSLPRRQRSRKALVELEQILDLSEGTLTLPLQKQLVALNTRRMTQPASPKASIAPNAGFSSSSIDWSNEVYREMISVRTTMSIDRCTLTEKVTTLVRIPDVAKPTFHVGYHWVEASDSDADRPHLTDIEGATLGESLPLEGRTRVTCLYIPEFVKPGDLHQLSYTTITRSPNPYTRTTERWFAWPLRYYTVFLDFGGHEPKDVEWVQVNTQEVDGMTQRIESIRPLTPINSTVQVTAASVDGGSSVVRWSW